MTATEAARRSPKFDINPDRIRMTASWPKPPITKNRSFGHWAPRRAAEQSIFDEAFWVSRLLWPTAAAAGWTLPITTPIWVRLVWTVTDKRRRDSSGPQPTLEAWIDGCIVGPRNHRGAGLIHDDRHEIVRRAWCDIEHGTKESCRIEIIRATQ